MKLLRDHFPYTSVSMSAITNELNIKTQSIIKLKQFSLKIMLQNKSTFQNEFIYKF